MQRHNQLCDDNKIFLVFAVAKAACGVSWWLLIFVPAKTGGRLLLLFFFCLFVCSVFFFCVCGFFCLFSFVCWLVVVVCCCCCCFVCVCCWFFWGLWVFCCNIDFVATELPAAVAVTKLKFSLQSTRLKLTELLAAAIVLAAANVHFSERKLCKWNARVVSKH